MTDIYTYPWKVGRQSYGLIVNDLCQLGPEIHGV